MKQSIRAIIFTCGVEYISTKTIIIVQARKTRQVFVMFYNGYSSTIKTNKKLKGKKEARLRVNCHLSSNTDVPEQQTYIGFKVISNNRLQSTRLITTL